jgi:hypothetical protein
MRKHRALIATMIAPFLMVVSSNSLEAAGESKFFLQDHGEVRVLRGLDPGTNFEPATLPEEIDVAPAAAPPELPVEPRLTTQTGPIFTRQAALQRARERGITVHGALDRSSQRPPEWGRNRREAIARARARGITIHRAGQLGWNPFSFRPRDTRGVPINRAGDQAWTPYSFRTDRLSGTSSLNR